jgi:L-lactate dehydrogenase complex protein LldG
MSGGREAILARVRAALADVPSGEPPAWDPDRDADPVASYLRASPGGRRLGELAELFAARCGEYRARVTRASDSAGAIRAAVAAVCERQGARALAVAPDLDPAWIPAGVEGRVDRPPLALGQLDALDGALSGCALAIAQTGTIVLDGGPGQGRRALTLIPDLHICVVRAAQLVPAVPEAVRAMAQAARATRAPLTLISGPSATSDIELVRIEGVHGPRRLEVVLAG